VSELLIDAVALQGVINDPDWMVFDVRYDLSDADAGRQAYLRGHIPGARFLDQGTQLAGRPNGRSGRHPLPDAHQFGELLRRHGLTPDSRIVVYDQANASFAARAWWLLRWMGYAHTKVLDGGMQAWLEAGGTLETTDPGSPPTLASNTDGGTPAAPGAPAMPTVSADEILSRASPRTRCIVDARTRERYLGQNEPIDPVAGHIDGALNRPIAENVQADGRFKSARQLRQEFTALLGQAAGDQVVHYCGSGITACHNLFSMELAGLHGSALYPGSWSEWCSDPGRPVAKG